jgi:hypothetical protein
MKRTSDTPGTGGQSGQPDPTASGSRAGFIIVFLVLGAGFLSLAAVTVRFYQQYSATGSYSLGLFACLSSVLTTVIFIGLVVVLSLRLRAKRRLSRTTAALISALERDPDPQVRAKAAEGLAELEQAAYNQPEEEEL